MKGSEKQRIAWSDVDDIDVGEDLYIHVEKGSSVMVPRQAFEHRERFDEFTKLASSHFR